MKIISDISEKNIENIITQSVEQINKDNLNKKIDIIPYISLLNATLLARIRNYLKEKKESTPELLKLDGTIGNYHILYEQKMDEQPRGLTAEIIDLNKNPKMNYSIRSMWLNTPTGFSILQSRINTRTMDENFHKPLIDEIISETYNIQINNISMN